MVLSRHHGNFAHLIDVMRMQLPVNSTYLSTTLLLHAHSIQHEFHEHDLHLALAVEAAPS